MGKKILVVDNDRFMLEFMTDLFSGQGHEVVTAEDGLSALEVLKNYWGYALDSTTPYILWFRKINMGRREVNEFYTRSGNCRLLSHAQV